MKIAHLSDLHICQKSRPQNLEKVRTLFEYALEENTDHFVITGDLVHLGETVDFLAFRQLLKEYDLLDPKRITLVIGNHDIYGGVHLAEDILTFPQKCKAVDYVKKLQEFKNYFFETYENTLVQSVKDIYPFVKIIHDVALIGINSTRQYSIVKNPFASKGLVDDAQLKKMKQLLSRRDLAGKRKIVLIHHYFHKISKSESKNAYLINLESFGGKLRKKKRLMKIFRRYKIDLVLHGHEHESAEYRFKGLRFFNAGGSIDKNQPGELKINFIITKPTEIQTKVETVRFQKILMPQLISVGAQGALL